MPIGTTWTSQEDERLAHLVQVHGPKKWSLIASQLETKGSKQCRRRWKNFIALEERKQGSWTAEEDAQLLDGHSRHGNKWTLIAQEIGGRTDNAVKNRFAALEKKRKGTQEAFERSVAPRLDDLGAPRVIYKDQPSYRDGDTSWLEQAGLQHCYGTGFMTHQTDIGSSVARRPDLMINIPGTTVVEVPYSQHPTGELQFCNHQDTAPGGPPSQLRPEDDGGMLSTSRQAAHNALTALSSPGQEPGAIKSLYRFLCSATPHDAQHGSGVNGRHSPPPWSAMPEQQIHGNSQHQQMQQQMHPMQQQQTQLQHLQQAPISMPNSSQQLQPQMYQQLPVTSGQPHLPDPQQLQHHLQPAHSMAASNPHHAQAYSPIMIQPAQQQSMYVSQQAVMQPAHQQMVNNLSRGGSGYYQQPAAASDVPYGLQKSSGAMTRVHTGHQLLEAHLKMSQHQQSQQAGLWHHTAVEPALSAPIVQERPSSTQAASVPMREAPVTSQLGHPSAQQHLQDQRHWGPEELRQLLDLLGDQQQQQCDASCTVTTAAPQATCSSYPAVEDHLQRNNNGNGVHSLHPPMAVVGPMHQGAIL